LISGGNAAKSSIYKPPKNQPAAIALAASVTAYDAALVPKVFTNIGMKIAPYLEVIELNGLAGVTADLKRVGYSCFLSSGCWWVCHHDGAEPVFGCRTVQAVSGRRTEEWDPGHTRHACRRGA
jgi:hypothetical protein